MEEEAQSQPELARAARIKVFLAEDHAVVREGVREIIRREPDMEVIGIFLMPLDTGLFSVYPDGQIVLLANTDLRGMQESLGPALKLEQTVAVIVQTSALDK